MMRIGSKVQEAAFAAVVLWTIAAGAITAKRMYDRPRAAIADSTRALPNAGRFAHGGVALGAASGPTVVIFTNYGCNACDDMVRRMDSLVARLPNVRVIERSFTNSKFRSPGARAMYCARDIGKAPDLRRAFATYQVEFEDSAWGALGSKAGIEDTSAFNECLRSDRHDRELQMDSLDLDEFGRTVPPLMLVKDSVHQKPVPLDELLRLLKKDSP